jgi:catechol 2,3-dioxygenase-like lactoylglutathione lyase family enzyme
VKPLTVLRVARPTNDLDAVIRFYKEGLGLQELYRFENHNGFDGVMLGRPGEPYHFEFTRARGHDAGRAPTEDNLVVFYLPDRADWSGAVVRMKERGYCSVRSFNPYWDKDGVIFEDCDGYRVVLQNADWSSHGY